ncbi:MAG: glucose-6-phosphate dehydrogenase [Candidatus Omnitrophica bacterium]|nr:glucose-6-phosphate dehydrogenase [Candidatus Omnitrophota bacterium]
MTTSQDALKVQVHHSSDDRPPSPCGFVIFGAAGDLTHRKLLPALFDLFRAQRLPKNFFILGVSRDSWTDERFRKEAKASIKEFGNTAVSKDFLSRLYYRSSDGTTSGFKELAIALHALEKRHKTGGNVLFYLAVPPSAFGDIASQLHQQGLIYPAGHTEAWSRVVFEKPFGRDLESANALNAELHRFLREENIYRIDHYLGKETVQNILMFRFANTILEPLWNRNYIDHIQIMAYETLGVEHRAGYYEKAGALRDMFQNHMFQLLTLCAMEPPAHFTADQYLDEKAQVLLSLRPVAQNQLDNFVVRGQYAKGTIGRKKVPGYRQEPEVDRKSQTETFVAMKLFIDNWRWHGVPFYLRSGKRLISQGTEILVQFKQIPHSIFASFRHQQFASNILCFRIQPDEGISFRFEAKQPGPEINLASINFNFDYKTTFHTKLMGAYERLLLDCMHGDRTLFIREDIVDLSWKFITPILKHWEKSKRPVALYPAGSWGPKEAMALIHGDGRKWRSYVPNYNIPTDGYGKEL